MLSRNAVLVTGAAVLLASAAAAAVVTNERIELTGLVVFVECANGGAGEEVVLEGPLHVVLTTTLDRSGGFHARSLSQPQGVAGTGQVTGDRYRGTGVTQDQFSGKVGQTYTYVNVFNIIGQGPGNNALLHETVHYTVNPDGTVAVLHGDINASCR